MSMLNGILSLHDIDDLEKHCAKSLTDALRHFRARLQPHDHEEALSFFIERAWELSLAYDASRGWSFSKLAYSRNIFWLVDWYEQRFPGRRRGARPQFVSLDHDGPGLNLAVSDRLPTPDRDPDGIPRVLTERREHRARDLRVLREAVLTDLAA